MLASVSAQIIFLLRHQFRAYDSGMLNEKIKYRLKSAIPSELIPFIVTAVISISVWIGFLSQSLIGLWTSPYYRYLGAILQIPWLLTAIGSAISIYRLRRATDFKSTLSIAAVAVFVGSQFFGTQAFMLLFHRPPKYESRS